jgi:hypothetical protein
MDKTFAKHIKFIKLPAQEYAIIRSEEDNKPHCFYRFRNTCSLVISYHCMLHIRKFMTLTNLGRL